MSSDLLPPQPPIPATSSPHGQSPISREAVAPHTERRPNMLLSLWKKVGLVWTGFLAWAGFQEKTLWDWFHVILIPIVLAIYTLVTPMKMAEQQTKAMEQQNRIADEQLKSDILWKYTNTIQDLVLHEGLLQAKLGDDVQITATVQTTLALSQLDGERKAHLLYFIYQFRLINIQNPIIKLNGADLKGANLVYADLRRANLAGADLTGADLTWANLTGANLEKANLTEAKLERTILTAADLGWANLRRTNLTWASLAEADLTEANLTEAIMPDGSRHP
jgi:uncharacterized protein YjbI with pentapeptide repeats